MTWNRTRQRLVPGIIAGLLVTACSGNSIAGTADGQQQVLLQPGKIHEACMRLTPAQQLHYRFTANAELAFNIHYHDNHKVHYAVAEHPASRADASFAPDSAQHYCLMWSNRSDAPVELRTQQAIVSGSQ